jgi:hypothetical protein
MNTQIIIGLIILVSALFFILGIKPRNFKMYRRICGGNWYLNKYQFEYPHPVLTVKKLWEKTPIHSKGAGDSCKVLKVEEY